MKWKKLFFHLFNKTLKFNNNEKSIKDTNYYIIYY